MKITDIKTFLMMAGAPKSMSGGKTGTRQLEQPELVLRKGLHR